ncbi:MAG: DUF2726 domain-containing protein [Betaproteobacteria bacterium]|jgi:hypothetical protein|nr:DUF2726 domain-containing protein [Burkholderiaceae bacterium]MCZ8109620.1 DUF2726 domain-containing protein [Rubrivivax sp.]MCZ8175880.1 DUF2726 domain-containing protein [Burkholderiaceae bacterium]
MNPSPILAFISFLLLLTAGVLWLRFGRRREKPLPTKWPLSPRRVFGPVEQRVHRLLREALPHHLLLPKLPLVRFCQPDDPGELRYWYDLLGSQHVSFAICSESGRVLAAIDLDGLRPVSRRGRELKEAVLGACQVRYLRCSTDDLPTVAELRALVPEPASKGVPVARMSQASVQLSATVAERRRERQVWCDTDVMTDSFFDRMGPGGAVSSLGAGSVPPVSVMELDLPLLDEPAVGIVVDHIPAVALRA